MTTIIPVLTYESFEDVLNDVNNIADRFKESSILCVRGIRATKDDQVRFARNLGDILSCSPNNQSQELHEYVENHSRNDLAATSQGDEVILNWHMERMDYDRYNPLVAGIWNMEKFTCSSNVGMTYFVDSRNVYKKLFSESEKSFLRKVEVSWIGEYSQGRKFTNTAKVVVPHWLDGKEQIRLQVHYLESLRLFKFDDEDPTEDQEAFFQELAARFVKEVQTTTEMRIVQRWQEGDILITDLYTMAHAVTGGFSPEEREFTGLWCYIGLDQAQKSGAVHPSWGPKT
jgi:alpha-ketoglutarate-dependent taurine dioxygenase